MLMLARRNDDLMKLTISLDRREPCFGSARVLLDARILAPAKPRGSNYEFAVVFRGMIHLRRPAFTLHASMRFSPRGQFRAGLGPVHQACLIAPFQQLAHCRAMRFR